MVRCSSDVRMARMDLLKFIAQPCPCPPFVFNLHHPKTSGDASREIVTSKLFNGSFRNRERISAPRVTPCHWAYNLETQSQSFHSLLQNSSSSLRIFVRKPIFPIPMSLHFGVSVTGPNCTLTGVQYPGTAGV